jgi:hypothetical protein
MNQKNSHRQQQRAQNKQLRQEFLRGFGKCHIRLKKRDQQRNVSKTDHVGMRVHLRAAVLEQAPDVLKSGARRPGIVRRNSTRGREQVLSDSICVGMKDKRGKNIAEDHSTEDEADSADDKDSSCTAWRKSLFGLYCGGAGVDFTSMNAHRGSELAIAAGSIAAFYADA